MKAHIINLAKACVRPFWIGIIAGSVAILLIGLFLVSPSMTAQSLYALIIDMTKELANKLMIVVFANLIALAFLIRLLAGTHWVIRARQLAVATIGMAILVGGVFNLIQFNGIDRSEIYHLQAKQAPTLAELTIAMPDTYNASDVLVWLRQHTAGAELTTSIKDLQSAGLAFHRLVGVSHLHIRAREKSIGILDVIAREREFKRFHVSGAPKQVWIDTKDAQPNAKLCAVPTAEALLIISFSDVPRCEAMK